MALPGFGGRRGFPFSRGDHEVTKVKQRPTDPAFPKSARIAIIGGGPAGLTMANELQKRGYCKVGFKLHVHGANGLLKAY